MDEIKRCGDCKYLDDKKTIIGYRCSRPNWTFRTTTAMFKYATTPGCKAFEEKEKKKP